VEAEDADAELVEAAEEGEAAGVGV